MYRFPLADFNLGLLSPLLGVERGLWVGTCQVFGVLLEPVWRHVFFLAGEGFCDGDVFLSRYVCLFSEARRRLMTDNRSRGFPCLDPIYLAVRICSN